MTKNNNIRVRFAPSPTGYIHIGSLRTALFNFLYARNTGGKNILRIEDTDQSRKVEGAVENLVRSLGLLGIEFDEGPVQGGDKGPYYQSERLAIYRKYCDELLEKKAAYYAFETPEVLDEMRKLQQLEGRQTMYDGRARDLSDAEVKENLDKGIPYVIRLKVPKNEEVKFEDLIKGVIKIETNIIDDQILLKSDGFPTYHLANVIDDHLMEITLIIRGEEWITSVPKHILIYKALGWDVPAMAHVPLILNPDKTKLSKRQGDVAVEDYLKKGYLKDALINFIAMLGWNPGEGEENEFFSMEELSEKFSLEKVQSSGAVFNVDKLNWMNNSYIKNYDPDKLLELSLPYFKSSGVDITDTELTKKILLAIRVYLNKLDEIPEHTKIFTQDKVEIEDKNLIDILKTDTSVKVFKELIRQLESVQILTAGIYKEKISEVQRITGIKGKLLFKPVRLALTGSENGPDLPAIAEILGRDKIIKLLGAWL
ncbi:MAG TPA: glutamate--tRNA ligase [Ignavibacteria bacterium]|nr:glutamate--tRNA ligase [Bacteroidota bacterium]HRI84756.1 glutamate--tRNA ligase [Ignavibacteria bacterium]HRJ98185.1 glutamate--tRNA ligase [Ignavibacteria bacterium]